MVSSNGFMNTYNQAVGWKAVSNRFMNNPNQAVGQTPDSNNVWFKSHAVGCQTDPLDLSG